MSRRARHQIPDRPRDRPQVPDVQPLVTALYKVHGAGCCLHLALDDGNLDADSIRYCLGYAKENGHGGCVRIAEMLLQMTPTQRRRLHG